MKLKGVSCALNQSHVHCCHLQVFDALVVANGHYSEPNLPDVPGAQHWPGLQMHSHNYRVPEAFEGQTVVVVGASNSGGTMCAREQPCCRLLPQRWL
jgi:cation diffusion facilitator CzcD-associated flavoprotein CzcO